jgi:hypothetical protein
MNDGKFIYKQIGPVERKSVIGILTQDGGHFQVIANGKKYNVLFLHYHVSPKTCCLLIGSRFSFSSRENSLSKLGVKMPFPIALVISKIPFSDSL